MKFFLNTRMIVMLSLLLAILSFCLMATTMTTSKAQLENYSLSIIISIIIIIINIISIVSAKNFKPIPTLLLGLLMLALVAF